MRNAEFIKAYGSLVQNGYQNLQGISVFADEFVNKHNEYREEIEDFGYSQNLTDWCNSHQAEIIQLYNMVSESND